MLIAQSAREVESCPHGGVHVVVLPLGEAPRQVEAMRVQRRLERADDLLRGARPHRIGAGLPVTGEEAGTRQPETPRRRKDSQ